MISLLIITAAVLGLLAFFEPCTIATHTLFSVRINQADGNRAWHSLVLVWLSRTALLITILTLAVILTAPPQWGYYTPSIILTVMALLYVVSRFIYIPVPHLEFFRLLPGGRQYPFALQLGLTLPACTLPLIVVTTGLAITVDSTGFAILAGFLFATLFTLPLLLTTIRGVNSNTRQLLNRAAQSSPYLTAILLLGTALYLLIPALNISEQSLTQSLQTASLAGIGLAFLAGLVFSFNPVSFAAVPVMLAYVTKAHEPRRAVLMAAAFIAGMLLTHVVLGVAAALGGEWVQHIMGRHWGLLLGPVLIIMGLVWSGMLTIRLPWFGVKGRKVTGIWGAFFLAIPFSVAVCPFCTPALLVTLTASAAIGSAGFGFMLLLAFALGRSIPIMLGAWSMGWLESLSILSRYQKIFELIAGLVLILSGLYLLNEYFLIIEY